MATLTLHPPDGASVVVELQHDVVTLGRNPDNRIVISSSYISGYHARFNRVKGTDAYEITDLQSHNGTRINGSRIETQRLCHGDMIQLGPALLARFEQTPAAVAEVAELRAAHHTAAPASQAAPEVKASVTYNGSGHGGRTGTPVAEASLLAEQRDELEQLKGEAKKRRNELRVGEAQLKEVRTERDTLLEAIAEAHREQAKVRDAAFAQDGVLRSGREIQAELESGIRQLKETQEREREALQKLRAEWVEYAAKHQEIQINLEAARRDCLTIAGQAEQQREAQDTMARKVAARREEVMHLDKEAKALSEEQDLLQAAQAGRTRLGAAAKAAKEELRGLETRLTKARLDEQTVSTELTQGRADLAALQKMVTVQRETQKTMESAMAELRDQAAASEARAAAAQTGQGQTAAELESTRQALVTAEKQLGQQQALVKEAARQLEALRGEAQQAGELLESRQQELGSAAEALGKLELEAQALRRSLAAGLAERDQTVAALRDQQAEREALSGQLETARTEMVRLTRELETRRTELKELGKTLGAMGQDPAAVVAAFDKTRLAHEALVREMLEKQADLKALDQAALTQGRELAAAQEQLRAVTAQWQARHEELRNFDLKIAQAKPQLAAVQHELAIRAKEQEAFQTVEARKAAVLEEVRQLETRHAALQTSHARLETACQELSGTWQQIAEAGARLSQLNQAIGEAEAAATLQQQELDRKLSEKESRLKELEIQAAEHRRQIAEPLPVPPAPAPATGPDATTPAETSWNPTEPAGSIEDELIRLGFRVQPVKKNPGKAK